MKIKIVIGCFFAIVLLMLVPSIPAVEITTAKEINRIQMLKELKTIDPQTLKEKLQILDKKELRQRIFEELSEHKDQFGIDPELLWYILYNIISYIFAWINFFIFWIIAIPQIILFGIILIIGLIANSLGLIPPPEKI